MLEITPDYKTAEGLRKNKQYAEALQHFATLWEQKPSVYTGWRYAQCLRKTERVSDAERIARAALEKYPDDMFTKGELLTETKIT